MVPIQSDRGYAFTDLIPLDISLRMRLWFHHFSGTKLAHLHAAIQGVRIRDYIAFQMDQTTNTIIIPHSEIQGPWDEASITI